MKAIALFFTWFFVLVLSAFSCNKQEEKTYINLYFELPILVSPVKDTIHIGDTLWIEANFSDSIYESTSKKRYPIANFDFQVLIGLFKIDATKYLAQQPGALSYFGIINVIGGIVRPQQTFGDFKFIYSNSRYKAKAGLIPKQKGIFTFNLFSLSETSDSIEGLSKELFKKQGSSIIPLVNSLGLRYPINDSTKTNYHLFKKYGKLGDSTSSTNVYFERKQIYTFIVID